MAETGSILMHAGPGGIEQFRDRLGSYGVGRSRLLGTGAPHPITDRRAAEMANAALVSAFAGLMGDVATGR